MNNPARIPTAVLLLIFFAALQNSSSEQIVDLHSDYRVTPLAVDRSDPLLSWRLEGTRSGLSQTAYQIHAATTLDKLDQPDLWDSSWVSDSRSMAIEYAGKLPAARQRVFWRIRIKDDTEAVLPWSTATCFDVGLLQDSDWQRARWISCDRKLQTEYGPADVMGDWIAADTKPKKAPTITYKFKFTLPEKHVVFAGAWWNHVNKGTTELMVNGWKGLSGPEGPPTIYYKDYSFYMGTENDVSITLKDADTSTPVSFGMKIVFADGSEEIIQTSADWEAHVEEEQVREEQIGDDQVRDDQQSAKVVCEYGEEPLGEAQTSPRAPLAAAWYKKDLASPKKSLRRVFTYADGDTTNRTSMVKR